MRPVTSSLVLALSLSGLLAVAPSAADDGPPVPDGVDGPAGPAAPFRVITLAEALEMAAAHNYDMKNIDESIVQADTMIGTAWSMLLPSLDASASIIRNQREVSMQFPDFSTMQIDPTTGQVDMEMTDMVLQEKWGKSYGFSAYLTLLNPRAFPLLKNAYDYTELARANARVQKNELLFAVTSAYYQVHTAKEIVGVQREYVAFAEEFVRLSEARVKAGQGTEIDIVRARLQLMDAEKALENAGDGVASAKIALARLIGADGEIDVAGPEQVAPIELRDRDLADRAVSSREEIAAADIATRMAERSRVETWMKWLPVFDVTYSWSWSSASGFSGENASWMLIFGARWNLFDGGGRIAESKSRASQVRVAENTRANAELQIREQVEQLAIEVRKQQRNVEIADQQVEVAEEGHRQVVRQYEVGLATSLELHDAEIELARIKISRVIGRLGYDLSVLALEKAVGEYSSLASVAAR